MNIPILMYHGVADDPTSVPYGHLLQPTDHFERCMRWLAENGFTTISLLELYHHIKTNKSIPHKSIVLTFDDGYLDNWVFVYSILKRYKMKGTLFINPEFVDPTNTPRPILDHTAEVNNVPTRDFKWSGHLSWAEMKEMERTGVMDVQSHTLTHTYYFASDKIIDFHHPNDAYYWVAWNENPQRKHAWVDESQEETIGYGTPIYEYGRSLGVRRYFDNSDLKTHLIAFVKENGLRDFFKIPGWRNHLWKEVASYRSKHGDDGRYETRAEYEKRLQSEVVDSKLILEQKLNKQIKFLCWPGGAHSEESYHLALKSGHLAVTKGKLKNTFGNDPSQLHRIAAYVDITNYSARVLQILSLPFFILQIRSYLGDKRSALVLETAAKIIRTYKHPLKAVKKYISTAAFSGDNR